MQQQLNELWDLMAVWVATYGLRIPVALVVLLAGLWVSRRISNLVRAGLRRRNVDDALNGFLGSMVYYTLVAAVVIAAIGQLGINITSFLAVLGAAGLAIGLALKDSLSNFASGVMLILMRFFKAGDWVDVGGQSGTVSSVQIFHTVLLSADNKRIVVPNSRVMTGNIVNYSCEPTRRVDMVFGIGYGDDVAKAKAILERLLGEDERVLDDPAPLVAVDELADSSVNFVVRPWCKTDDYWGLKREMTEKVKLAFDAEGISIPFPQRDVHLYNEN